MVRDLEEHGAAFLKGGETSQSLALSDLFDVKDGAVVPRLKAADPPVRANVLYLHPEFAAVISVLSYVTEDNAARTHGLAALKYWGISDYEKEIEIMKNMNQDEFVAYIRRQSSCFSRETSSYRGVTRRKDGKWQAPIGRIGESRDTKGIYLGTFETEVEAAEAYDLAAIELRGVHAVTNFNISNYCEDSLKKLESSSEVPVLEGQSDVTKLAG